MRAIVGALRSNAELSDINIDAFIIMEIYPLPPSG